MKHRNKAASATSSERSAREQSKTRKEASQEGGSSTLVSAQAEAGGNPNLDRFLGLAIRQERQRQQLTIAEVAERTVLSRGMLSKIENGQASMSLDSLSRIAGALGVSMASLFRNLEAREGAMNTFLSITIGSFVLCLLGFNKQRSVVSKLSAKNRDILSEAIRPVPIPYVVGGGGVMLALVTLKGFAPALIAVWMAAAIVLSILTAIACEVWIWRKEFVLRHPFRRHYILAKVFIHAAMIFLLISTAALPLFLLQQQP